MATQTTYYEFNKPEGTDLVNPLVDTNPNWDALDADLHEFNERSISNCTEIVTLGVHAISRLDQTAKFLKWIATANFTAGDTFTVDGLVVAASTPAGAALATNAYVTGSVVLACLNADNSAMTIFVSGTNVATDSERLGGKLPSYYGTASDVSDNATDITNLQNQVGNTSIVGIGDGTCTGAIDALNTNLSDIGTIVNVPLKSGTASGQYAVGDISEEISLSKGKYIVILNVQKYMFLDVDVYFRFLVNNVQFLGLNSYIFEVSTDNTPFKVQLYNNGSGSKTFTYSATTCDCTLMKIS